MERSQHRIIFFMVPSLLLGLAFLLPKLLYQYRKSYSMTHTSVKVLKWIKVNAANPFFFHNNSILRGIIPIISNRSFAIALFLNHSPNTPILQFPSTSNQNYSNMFYSNVLFRLKNGLIEKRKTLSNYHKRKELNETKRICASRCRNILFRLDLMFFFVLLFFFSRIRTTRGARKRNLINCSKMCE